MKLIKSVFVFLLTLVLMSGVASALPLTIEEFELDGVELMPDATTRLDLERDQEYPVRIKFTPTANLVDAEFTLFISGYEYNQYQKIADSTRTDDYGANTTYTQRMTITLPSDIDENDYRLRLLITDRDGDESIYNYYLRVDSAKHKLNVEDIVLSPAGQVESGHALYLNARLENEGRIDERDVKVVFSIPELNLQASGYVEEVEANEEEELEDGITLVLPSCVAEKEYTVRATALYDNKHKEAVAEEKIWVTESPKCKNAAVEPVVVPAEPKAEPLAEKSSKIRSALEVALLVLVGLLVVIGLIIGFSKLGSKEEF